MGLIKDFPKIMQWLSIVERHKDSISYSNENENEICIKIRFTWQMAQGLGMTREKFDKMKGELNVANKGS